MGRCLGTLGIIFGLTLIGIAVVSIILFASDTDFSNDLIGNTFCEDNETPIRKSHSTTMSDGTQGTSYTFFCEDNTNGNQREITNEATTAGIGGFALNLVCGILIVIGSAMSLASRAVKNKMSQVQAFNQQFGNMGQGGTAFQMPNNVNVTFTQESYTAQEVEERLRMLQEMLNNGTLSQDQYFSIEQELRSRQR